MTKKKNLTAFMIAIIVMLFSLPANAQGTVGYAELKGSTLTFKGGESVPTGAFALNTGNYNPGWYANDIKGSVTKVVFDESFKDVRPTSCYKWFCDFSQLTKIEGIENLNTEDVTDMSVMFYDCKKLTSLDLSSFNTDKVKNMIYMFYNCGGVTTLDLSSFNTTEVLYMSRMFSGCSGLKSLDVSKLNTAKVTDMVEMFNSCSGLTSLDLSSFNTAKVEYMSDMFNGCSGLTTIYVSDDFTIGNVTYGLNMFSGCSNLIGATSYSNSGITDKSMANYKTGYFTKSNLTPYVKWDANTKVLTFKVGSWGKVHWFTL